ncbi:UNVERIFIED_CONTAM: hypothetical protein FKN15_004175 [Acipenser sinensis]
MKVGETYFLLVLLCALGTWLDLTAATGHNSTVVKPGHCPRKLQVAPSKRACVCDEDCPGDDKCCVFACGAVCVPPAFTKPGVCPRRQRGAGMCAEFCSDDSDCPKDEKCCSNGCGHECTAPYTGRVVHCTTSSGQRDREVYVEEQKCCRTTCGHACSEPC